MLSITDMAYKYFFKTLSGQGERLLQCGDVIFGRVVMMEIFNTDIFFLNS